MNENLLGTVVEEMNEPENISYLVKQDEMFFMTGYKVLQSKESRGLVECARLRYNGRIKLVYFTTPYISLQQIMNYLDVIGMRAVLRNLIGNILAIKNNGFLKCENLMVTPERIFVDRNTLEVYLIYLPVKIAENTYDRNDFENNLRTQLIKLLNSNVNISGSDIKEILFELSNGSASMEQLYQFLQQVGTADVGMKEYKKISDGLSLESQDGKIQFDIMQDEFVIGKNASVVNGVITGNPAVSRRHCKIVRKNQQYFIVDLKSSNGTYVNGNRVTPQEEILIESGMQITIANEMFIVR